MLRSQKLAIGILCLALGEILIAQQQPTVRKHREIVDDGNAGVAKAEAAMEANSFAIAEGQLLEVVKSHPENYRAWFDLGYVYRTTDRNQESIDAYRKSVAAKPDVFESNLNLGLMLAQAGNSEAATFFRAATTLTPTARPEEGRAKAWLSLAQVLEASKPTEAVEAYRHLSELQPKNAAPHLGAALVLEKTNDLSGAAAEFERASELDPKSTEALAGLVNAYSKTQRWAEAEASLRKYLELNPQNPSAHIQLGRLLVAQKKFDAAIPEFSKGVELAPGDGVAERELANLYLQQKQFDRALPYLQSAAQKSPQDPQVQLDLGRALMSSKRFPEAQAAFQRTVQIKPDLGEVYGDLAFAASENKDYPLTLQALDARSRHLPESPVTLFLRASTLDHMRSYKEAADAYHKFLEIANGTLPDQEFQARHRLIAIEPKKR